MSHPTNVLPADKQVAIIAAIDAINTSLERTMVALGNLKNLLLPDADTDLEFDPADPANKVEGGDKLTERGVEVCYRLYDAGKTRYAVASAMHISFGAADYRFRTWEKAGGVNRIKKQLD